MERKDKKWFKRDIIVLISFLILFVSISFLVNIGIEMSLPGFRIIIITIILINIKVLVCSCVYMPISGKTHTYKSVLNNAPTLTLCDKMRVDTQKNKSHITGKKSEEHVSERDKFLQKKLFSGRAMEHK